MTFLCAKIPLAAGIPMHAAKLWFSPLFTAGFPTLRPNSLVSDLRWSLGTTTVAAPHYNLHKCFCCCVLTPFKHMSSLRKRHRGWLVCYIFRYLGDTSQIKWCIADMCRRQQGGICRAVRDQFFVCFFLSYTIFNTPSKLMQKNEKQFLLLLFFVFKLLTTKTSRNPS